MDESVVVPSAKQTTSPTIILASGSPRRREFLNQLGLAYSIQVADIDETPLPNERPTAIAQRLAKAKALAVALSPALAKNNREKNSRARNDAIVIAADTVVALGSESLGKPATAAEATAMLRQLRNRIHQVITVVSIVNTRTQRQHTRVNVTDVHMRDYSDTEIADYVASGDPFDKAGGYAIQHPDFAPVAQLDGCLSAVIGLPLGDLREMLDKQGISISCPLHTICQGEMQFHCCHRPAS